MCVKAALLYHTRHIKPRSILKLIKAQVKLEFKYLREMTEDQQLREAFAYGTRHCPS